METLVLIDKDGNEYSAGKESLDLKRGDPPDVNITVDIRAEGKNEDVVAAAIEDVMSYLVDGGSQDNESPFEKSDEEFDIPEDW